MYKELKTLTYVGGSKGGTGKSLVCMGLMDFIQRASLEKEILLFETDSTNPDVGRLYKKTKGITVENLALNENEKNWTNLLNIIEKSKAPHIVINSMAGANFGINSKGDFLNEAIDLGVINVDFKTLWVMNKDRDSVDLLKQYMECIKHATVFPIKNLYFGDEDDFSYYKESPEGRVIREMVAKRGGEEFYFPVMNQDLTHMLYTQQLNFEEIREKIPGGLKISLSRWTSKVKSIFSLIYPSLVCENGAKAGNPDGGE